MTVTESPASCLTQVFAYISGLPEFSPERGLVMSESLHEIGPFVVGPPVDS